MCRLIVVCIALVTILLFTLLSTGSIAQEGEGLSFSARNASELGAAFAQVVATPAELPEGR